MPGRSSRPKAPLASPPASSSPSSWSPGSGDPRECSPASTGHGVPGAPGLPDPSTLSAGSPSGILSSAMAVMSSARDAVTSVAGSLGSTRSRSGNTPSRDRVPMTVTCPPVGASTRNRTWLDPLLTLISRRTSPETRSRAISITVLAGMSRDKAVPGGAGPAFNAEVEAVDKEPVAIGCGQHQCLVIGSHQYAGADGAGHLGGGTERHLVDHGAEVTGRYQPGRRVPRRREWRERKGIHAPQGASTPGRRRRPRRSGPVRAVGNDGHVGAPGRASWPSFRTPVTAPRHPSWGCGCPAATSAWRPDGHRTVHGHRGLR